MRFMLGEGASIGHAQDPTWTARMSRYPQPPSCSRISASGFALGQGQIEFVTQLHRVRVCHLGAAPDFVDIRVAADPAQDIAAVGPGGPDLQWKGLKAGKPGSFGRHGPDDSNQLARFLLRIMSIM